MSGSFCQSHRSGQVLGAQCACAGSVYNYAPRVSGVSLTLDLLFPRSSFLVFSCLDFDPSLLSSHRPHTAFFIKYFPGWLHPSVASEHKSWSNLQAFMIPRCRNFIQINLLTLWPPWNSHNELLSVTAGWVFSCFFSAFSFVWMILYAMCDVMTLSLSYRMDGQYGLIWRVWNRLVQLEKRLSF